MMPIGAPLRVLFFVDERCRHGQGQCHEHGHQGAPWVGEQVRHEAEHADDDGCGRSEREARDEADDAGWVVFEPLHAWDDREFDEADGHGQRHEQRVHGDAFGGPAAGVGDACGVRVVRTGHRLVCGLIGCGIGGIARRGYTHVELRFFHPDCNRWPRILTGSTAFAGRGLRYGAVMNAGRAVTASKDFHLPETCLSIYTPAMRYAQPAFRFRLAIRTQLAHAATAGML